MVNNERIRQQLSLQILPPRADTGSNQRCGMEWRWPTRLCLLDPQLAPLCQMHSQLSPVRTYMEIQFAINFITELKVL